VGGFRHGQGSAYKAQLKCRASLTESEKCLIQKVAGEVL
jgi:hypothetical protein